VGGGLSSLADLTSDESALKVCIHDNALYKSTFFTFYLYLSAPPFCCSFSYVWLYVAAARRMGRQQPALFGARCAELAPDQFDIMPLTAQFPIIIKQTGAQVGRWLYSNLVSTIGIPEVIRIFEYSNF